MITDIDNDLCLAYRIGEDREWDVYKDFNGVNSFNNLKEYNANKMVF